MEDGCSQQPLDLSIGGYLSRKRAKLGAQIEAETGRRSALLAGVHVFVNGRTTPSQRVLWQLITQNGGSFSAIMCPGVTHVIATGLAQTKVAQFRKSRVHVVTPDWIVESIRRNSLLSVAQFPVPDLLDSSQPCLTNFFGRSSTDKSTESDETKMSEFVQLEVDNHQGPDFSEIRSVSDSSTPMESVIPKDESEQVGLQSEHVGHCEKSDADGDFPTSEDELMRRLGDHRFDKIPYRNPKLPSCTLTDPNFVKNYFSQSRLHFIGSWKEKFECCLVNELRQQNPIYALAQGEHGHILHVDMDCFFASISIRDRPDLKEKPVAVSHSKSGTGEVSTCNYVARSFGVRSGMWMGQARKLCPDLVVVGFEFEKYTEASESVYRIFYTYTHNVQVLSCDEAFLEVPLNSDPVAIGEQIRSEIFLSTGCTASVGIGDSMLFARVATRFAKPNGILFIKPDLEQHYLSKLDSVQELPTVGPSKAATLHNELGIDSIAQLREASLATLQSVFGVTQGQTLHDFARGIDRRSLVTDFKERSQIGTELGWGIRFFVSEQVEHFLSMLCAEVGSRLEMAGRFGLMVSLRVKKRHPRAPIYPTKFLGQGWCESFSKSVSLPIATRDPHILFSHCKAMIRSLKIPPHEIRAVGLYVTRLQTSSVAVNTINKYFCFDSSKRNHDSKDLASSSYSVVRNDSATSSSTLSSSPDGVKKNLNMPLPADLTSFGRSIEENPIFTTHPSGHSDLKLPDGWDPVVFMELPESVRCELLQNISTPLPLTSPIKPEIAAQKEERSGDFGAIDFNNIDLNVLHELPRDLRMEIQFELKKRRVVKAKRSKPKTEHPN